MASQRRLHLAIYILALFTVLVVEAQVGRQGIADRAGVRSSSRSAGSLFEDSVSTATMDSIPARKFLVMDQYVTIASAGEPPHDSFNPTIWQTVPPGSLAAAGRQPTLV
jgi:hypothetical protein